MSIAIEVRSLTHRYRDRVALRELDLDVQAGAITALLGPNGSGKSTLFRILSTLIPPTSGDVRVFGMDVVASRAEIRRDIGVAFQSPSLDKQLTVAENLRFHARLFGLSPGVVRTRIAELLDRFALTDRANERAARLSGGLRRRVEIAKAMISRPRLLILDEPGTGLDPGARADMIRLLGQLRDEQALTIVLTTHLMEEADRCDHVAILNEGSLVASGTPTQLKSTIEGDVIEIRGARLEQLRDDIQRDFGLKPVLSDGMLRVISRDADALLPKLLARSNGAVESCSLHRATLEDVFFRHTGRRIDGER
jgi:ABC-2 type transport system ATP-binding protein